MRSLARRTLIFVAASFVFVACQADEEKLSSTLQQMLNLSPRGIREHLGLNRPIYARTAAYGHFGRAPEPDGGFSWERLDLVEGLRSAFGA